VTIQEMIVKEPPERCRKIIEDVKTKVNLSSWDKSKSNLFTGWMASGI
jgi:hypothetical protein